MNAKAIAVSLAVMAALLPSAPVTGQEWSNGSPYSSAGWGFGWPTSYYAADALPYFSLYPPVYYSYRVPRTFGYSPFAYPSGVLTPGAGSSRLPAGQTPVAQQGRPPLRIDNPFVEQSGSTGMTMNWKPPSRQPKVIYPAAMARRGSEPVRGS
jgi:hypothetical protein